MYQFYNRHETGHKLKTYFGPVLNLSAQIGALGDQKVHGPNIKNTIRYWFEFGIIANDFYNLSYLDFIFIRWVRKS